MDSTTVFTLKVGSGAILAALGTLSAGVGLLRNNNLLLAISGVQFLCGLGLILASAWSGIKTKVDRDGNRPSTNNRIAKWAELATSQTNAWMNAIRLHESGKYEDAYVYYFLDALSCSTDHDFTRAALSLTLAADCLNSAGQTALASRTLELAQTFHAGILTNDVTKSLTASRLNGDRAKNQSYVA
jgi:hypothetical protein